VVIVGGESAVSAAIASGLSASYAVTRIAGADRYATANAVAAAVRTNNSAVIGTFGGYRTAFLANGLNFPDALAASAWAYQNKHPLFLTNGTSLTADTVTAMTAAGVQQVIVLGGTSAVSADVMASISTVPGMIAPAIRIGGANRYETATLLATTLGESGVAGTASYIGRAYLVSGTNFPDALVASQLAGGAAAGVGAIIPVTSPLPAAVSAWATANQATLANVRAIGGTAAVPADLVTAVRTAATIEAITATITGVDGSDTVTVVFSAAVDPTQAAAAGSYTWRSVTGATKTITLGGTSGYVAATRTATLVLTGAVLAPGDTFSIIAGAITSPTVPGLSVAPASLTVAPDTVAPVATIKAFPGAATTNTVWVEFDKTIRTAATADPSAADICGEMVFTGSTIGSTPVALSAGLELVENQAFACQYAAAVTGGSVSLPSNTVTNRSAVEANRSGNALTTVAVTADLVAPTITSAQYSTTAVGGTQATFNFNAGNALPSVRITARAATAVAGLAGNLWTVETVTGSAIALAVNTTARTIRVTAPTGVTASAVVDALNGNATFSGLFIASTGPNGTGAFSDAAAANLSGGSNLVTITVTFSKPIGAPIADGDLLAAHTFTGVTLTGEALVDDDDWGGRLTGVLTIRAAHAAPIVSGAATVTAGTAIQSQAGVAMTGTAAQRTVGLFLAS
jgi:hypothetical protein